MRITCRANELALSGEDISPMHRAFNEDDYGKLEALAGKYAQMVKANQLVGLKDLGREIHDWLNGGSEGLA